MTLVCDDFLDTQRNNPLKMTDRLDFIKIKKCKVKLLNYVQLFVTPWTITYQAPLTMGFSWQEYWSGLPFPSPRDPPNPGIKLRSSVLQADALPSEPPGKPKIKNTSLQKALSRE